MRKILFLDIDGVLNSFHWHIWFNAQRTSDSHEFWNDIDPHAVACLNEIVERSQCEVVLSSTWRKGHTLESMNKILKFRGFRGTLIGNTNESSFWCERAGIHRHEHERGLEIEDWLRNNVEDLSACSVVILDDDSDMSRLRPRLVRTPHQTGLRRVHVQRALHQFKKPLGDLLPEVNPWLDRPAFEIKPKHHPLFDREPAEGWDNPTVWRGRL